MDYYVLFPLHNLIAWKKKGYNGSDMRRLCKIIQKLKDDPSNPEKHLRGKAIFYGIKNTYVIIFN